MTAKEAYEKARVRTTSPSYELESYILQDSFYAYLYALTVIKCRWPEAEPVIMQSASNSYLYAREVIQDRWPEAEPTIMQNVECASWYAKYILEKRWLEAEEAIAKSGYSQPYIEYFFDEPVITKDKVDIIQWERKQQVGYFAPASLFENKVSLLDMVTE